MAKIKSFDPVIDDETQIIILGTMPGEKSLKKGEYYADPKNQMWKILSEVFGSDFVNSTYQTKLALLKKHKVGLWDVIHECERVGSLDQNILEYVPSDLKTLISRYPELKTIGFNGANPHKLYIKLVKEELPLRFVILDSTSSAHAKKSLKEKAEGWKQLIATKK